MPTPVAHSLCGVSVYAFLRYGKAIEWRMLILVLLLANLPDADYIPGILVGRPNAFHHGWTHSVLFAILVGAGLWLLVYTKEKRGFWPVGVLFLSAVFSHLVLDYFTLDTSPPFGEQLLWPASGRYFLSPVAVFRDVVKGGTNQQFFQNALHPHNIRTVLTECLVFMPVAVLAEALRRRALKRQKKG